MADENPKGAPANSDVAKDSSTPAHQPAPKGDTGKSIPEVINDILKGPIESIGMYTKIRKP